MYVLFYSAIVANLQQVFAMLQLSQRATVSQFGLKSLLREPFCQTKQQDSHQYGQYILEQLENGLKGSVLSSLTSDIFGGTVANVLRCSDCGHARSLTETFTDLGVSFPKDYGAITHIAVISGKVASLAAPLGYDRISVNTNTDRKGAEFCYICIKRDASAPAITDVIILNAGNIIIGITSHSHYYYH